MTPEELQLLQNTANKLNAFLDVYYRTHFIDQDVFANPVFFQQAVSFKQGINLKDTTLQLGSTTGTKIGVTGDKIGFLGATPIVRAGAITSPTGGATIDSQARTAIDSIRVVLTNFGLTS